MASASAWRVTLAASIFFMPWMYRAKSLSNRASTGALSTAMSEAMSEGEVSARVMAVLAPLLCISDTWRNRAYGGGEKIHRVAEKGGLT